MSDNKPLEVTNGAAYLAWRGRMGFSHKDASEALGFCRRTSINYQNESTKKIPGAITKLCSMLERDKVLGL